MEDKSHLDKKYFIDQDVYNCPYCNRRNLKYDFMRSYWFDWSNKKKCYVYFVRCSSCEKESMHLSFEEIDNTGGFIQNIDIDSKIFYSVPTSFFVIDSRIPRILRELISEAESCIKMNFLTGASACTRKAIYELTIIERAEGEDYEKKIKFLKTKFTNINPEFFDILGSIKDMTSDKIHEQSWDKWDSQNLKLFIETLKSILHEIYVIPDERKKRTSEISKLWKKVSNNKKNNKT